MKTGALLVPQRAVTELQGGFRVAVVGADGKARSARSSRASGWATSGSSRRA